MAARAMAVRQCWLGYVLISCGDDGLSHVILGDSESNVIDEFHTTFRGATRLSHPYSFMEFALAGVIKALDTSTDYLGPLDVQGTDFQKLVWAAIREVPKGQTITYKALAKKVGKPNSYRAVANACNANPLAVVIPCHRVVGSGMDMGGYRWGTDKKMLILRKEMV